jgi:hypothetical protein
MQGGKKFIIRVKYFFFLEYSKTWLTQFYNSKFCHNSIFCLNIGPKEEKFVQLYLVISKTLIIRNLKEKSAL